MKCLLRIAVLCGLAISHPLVVDAQPVHLAQLPRTDGIATDPSGNIFVVADATMAKVLVLLDANGNLLGQLPMPNTSFTDIGTNNLVFDPVIPTLWVLKSNGDVFFLNLSTGAWVPLFTFGSPSTFKVFTTWRRASSDPSMVSSQVRRPTATLPSFGGVTSSTCSSAACL